MGRPEHVDLKSYPANYTLLPFAEGKTPRRAQTTFSRFTKIHDMEISVLLQKLISSLQGDDEADAGHSDDAVSDEDMMESQNWADNGGDMEHAVQELESNWTKLKE